jgi:hypothetical protein
LQELHDVEKNRAHERMADEMVQRIWSILSAHRRPPPPSPRRYAPQPETFTLDSEQEIEQSPAEVMLSDTDTPQPFESIAARRSRRQSTANVYYKEPSLRGALSPGDPYTFSVEGGFVTPTIPDGYSRDTPTVPRRATRGTRRK